MVYEGRVSHGKGRGKALGFPTLNIPLLTPVLGGVYAGVVRVGEIRYPAAVYIDTRRQCLEAHLLDFSGNLYDTHVSVELLTKVRDDAHFADEKTLKEAIQKDVTTIRAWFAQHP